MYLQHMYLYVSFEIYDEHTCEFYGSPLKHLQELTQNSPLCAGGIIFNLFNFLNFFQYRIYPCISRTFFQEKLLPKRGCGLSTETLEKTSREDT